MKKHFIIGLGLLICGALQAQETGNYLNFNVGGGLHNLSYNLQNGTQKGQFGYTINAGYSYFFTPQWGLHTGLGFQSFNSLSTLNYLSTTPEIDSEGVAYLFKANYKNWQEKQQALFIDIPLTIQYKLPVTKKFGLLASAGGKISIPVNTSYKTTGGEFVTSGYYEQWNVPLDNMPQHGFSTYNKEFKGKLNLKTAYMAIADLGGLYKLNEKLDLYAGAYINYGLNNILKATDKPIFQPNTDGGIYNGIFASSQTTSVTPVSIGLKVGVYWHLGVKKSTLDFNKTDESILSAEPISPLQPTEEPVQSVEPAGQAPEVQPIELVQPELPAEAPQAVVSAEPVPSELPVEPVQTVLPSEPEEAIVPIQTVEPADATQIVLPVEAVPVVVPSEPIKAVVPIEQVQTVQQAEPTQIVLPAEAVQAVVPAEPVQAVLPAEPAKEVEPTTPVKTANPVMEAAVIEPTPKVVETPKEISVENQVTPVAVVEPVQTDNSYELAQKLASEMNLMFGFNSFQVTNAKNDKIKELSRVLKNNSYIHLRFVGHTCNIGTYAINLLLGLKRADSVKQKFIEQGVPLAQLVSESKAYSEPLVPNTSKENRAKNRRVEIKVFK